MIEKIKKNKKELLVFSPVDGTMKKLSNVEDEVFSKKILGDGVAITPSNGEIYSPIKGISKLVFETGHAYGFNFFPKSPELLLHIGVDTINLEGEGFESKIIQEQDLNVDTIIAHVDLDLLKRNIESKKIVSTDIVLIVTNETINKYEIKDIIKKTEVKKGDLLFKLIKK